MVYHVNRSLTKQLSEQIVELDYQFKNPVSFISYDDEITGLSNISRISREFSVKYNNDNEWSQWFILTDINLQSFVDYTKDTIYFRFRFRLTEKYDSIPVYIKNISLDIKTKDEKAKTIRPGSGIGLSEIKETIDLGNFAKKIKNIEGYANLSLNTLYGTTVKYFRTLPDKNSVDHFLHEYNLKGVDKICDLKVTIPENNIPDDVESYDDWGINFDQFEIHIEPHAFMNEFGTPSYPREDDYVYIYTINRLYRVASTEYKRGVNEELAYYGVSLKTYEDDSNVIKNNEAKDFLKDKLRVDSEMFEEAVNEEMANITNHQQNQIKTINQDIVREMVNELMVINESPVYNNGTELLRNYYNLSAIPSDEVAIKYKHQHKIDESWGYSSWIKLPDDNEYSYHKITQQSIESMTVLDRNTVKLILGNQGPYNKLSILGIYDDSAVTCNGEIYDVKEVVDDYTLIINSTKLNPTFTNLQLAHKANLLQSVSNDLLSVDIYNTTKLRIRFGRDQYDYDINISKGIWYGIQINITNLHKYVGLYIYEMVDRSSSLNDKYSTLLKQRYKKEWLTNVDIKLSDCEPYIIGSYLAMSNIRFYKTVINEPDQSYVLANRILKKPSIAYIIDDADKILNQYNDGRGQLLNDKRDI